ncbi:MAG TPA: hypothetical protein VHI51_15060 [Ktedonobacterales bacterium]|jgi:hypothetical protein|nr:hypothetical protein [Ktedonobacterales bacterium]
MADDGESTDTKTTNGQPDALPDPVDLNARREQRQASNGASYPSGDATDSMQRAYEDISDELELQAREMVRVFRENMGELGERVRQAAEHAATLWNDAAEAPAAPMPSDPHPHELRARALVRRWVKRDFLVDPDLPTAMTHIALKDADIWRVELRERGETRTLGDSTGPYTGTMPPAPSAILPVWDYTFPTAPEIEAGERREPIAGSAMRAMCERCHGSGHRACAHCEGKGMTACPQCRGRGSKVCPRCRGRGRIADPAAERQARAAKSYVQVHAERFAQNAVERLADLSERLRQDYGAPLPPSADWAPMAPASGKTIACPDCVNGALPCACNNGKVVCAVCHGTTYEPCAACAGSGFVIRQRQVVRRFDTRIRSRVLAPTDPEAASWVTDQMLQRSTGEQVWEGAETELSGPTPSGVPERVWNEALNLKRAYNQRLPETPGAADTAPAADADAGERRVISRRLRLVRTPVARIEYGFAGRTYEAVAVGQTGQERFWADTFPPRWNRVSRFFQAVARDIAGESGRSASGGPHPYVGSGRDRSHIRIVEEPVEPPPAPETPADQADAPERATPDTQVEEF